MAQCTCTSPDGTQSTTYVFESAPYGGSMNCDVACRLWRWNHALSMAYPYGSPEREAKMDSCKMWLKECGSGPDFISLSEPRTECVAGDSVGAKLVVDQGHGMGQEVDVQLKVMRASDEIVDYAPNGTPRYKGVEGPLKTITNPNSPFYGQQVKTCMVNGFDSYVYQVTRYPSSSVDPIASTAWGDADLSSGDDVGQLAVPLFKFRKHGERITDPAASANYGLNPFYNPNAICSVEEYFEATGYDWTTMPHAGSNTCENKITHLFYTALGSGTGLHKSISDYEFACRMQMGELLPDTDFNEMYKRNFSENKMWMEWDAVAAECEAEDNPYDVNAYCALYHWNSGYDGGICTGYDLESNPLGSAWWSGTSNAYGGIQDADNPIYKEWLHDYLLNTLGIDAVADMSLDEVMQYHTNTTWSNFLSSPQAIEYGNWKKARMACVVTKMYEQYPDQFDWRGAFPPSNTQSGTIILPEEMVGTYDWFDENDVEYDGQVVLQTFSPTANEYGYEAIELPEGLVKLSYVEVPLAGQDEVAAFRGEVEVSEGINEARETLTDDTREAEGVFLPEDPEIEVLGAEQDLIDSIEQGQIAEEDLSLYFSEESAGQVAEMFEETPQEETPAEEPTDEETIFDDGEVDGEPTSDGDFDGMGEGEDDTFTGEETTEEDVTPEEEVEVEDEPVVIDEEEVDVEDEPVVIDEEYFPTIVEETAPIEAQSTIQPVAMEMEVDTASTAPKGLGEVLKSPVGQAVAVAGAVGLVTFLLMNRKK